MAQGLTQEQLAEKVGISVTHMSHVETGNTKMSLGVFVAIVQALEVHADDLLFDVPSGRGIALHEITELLDRCTEQQVRILADVVKATKISLDKYTDD